MLDSTNLLRVASSSWQNVVGARIFSCKNATDRTCCACPKIVLQRVTVALCRTRPQVRCSCCARGSGDYIFGGVTAQPRTIAGRRITPACGKSVCRTATSSRETSPLWFDTARKSNLNQKLSALLYRCDRHVRHSLNNQHRYAVTREWQSKKMHNWSGQVRSCRVDPRQVPSLRVRPIMLAAYVVPTCGYPIPPARLHAPTRVRKRSAERLHRRTKP